MPHFGFDCKTTTTFPDTASDVMFISMAVITMPSVTVAQFVVVVLMVVLLLVVAMTMDRRAGHRAVRVGDAEMGHQGCNGCAVGRNSSGTG